MSCTLLIHLSPDQGEEFLIIHLFRNFGEDVFRFLRDNAWGEVSLDEIDAASTQFSVKRIKNSKLRDRKSVV